MSDNFLTKPFFCPAPWTSIYYHGQTASPCHASTDKLAMSPEEYLQSGWLKNIKKQLLEGKVPKNCGVCLEKEQLGLKSTRGTIHKRSNKDSSNYTADQKTVFERIELRSSNLCNFSCRMCSSSSSSEIQKEIEKYPILKTFDGGVDESLTVTSDSNFEQLLSTITDNVHTICFTGGEPMLIKQYYDFMDFLIEKKISDNVSLEFFTNCSVRNPKFIERIMQFRNVRFVMSIDGVGKTAEYQRNGTKWETVEQNIMYFAELRGPIDLEYNTAISPFVLLDISSLAKFLMKVYEKNNNLATKCYSVTVPRYLHVLNMSQPLREKSIGEIDQALEILTPSNFDVITKELRAIRGNLISTPQLDSAVSFINHTRILDQIRNQKFEEVFGIPLS